MALNRLDSNAVNKEKRKWWGWGIWEVHLATSLSTNEESIMGVLILFLLLEEVMPKN